MKNRKRNSRLSLRRNNGKRAKQTLENDLVNSFFYLLDRSEARIDETNKMVFRLVEAIERENRERHEFLRRERERLDRLSEENAELRIQNRRLMYSVERKGDYINMQSTMLNHAKAVNIMVE